MSQRGTMNKTIRSEQALATIRHIQDVIAGAPVTDEHLDSVELWVGLEEAYGNADGGASQVIRALIREVRAHRSGQPLLPAGESEGEGEGEETAATTTVDTSQYDEATKLDEEAAQAAANENDEPAPAGVGTGAGETW